MDTSNYHHNDFDGLEITFMGVGAKNTKPRDYIGYVPIVRPGLSRLTYIPYDLIIKVGGKALQVGDQVVNQERPHDDPYEIVMIEKRQAVLRNKAGITILPLETITRVLL